MRGQKLSQLKDAMYSILRDMKGEDMINLIFFNNQVTSSRAVYATRRSQEYAIGLNETFMQFCQLERNYITNMYRQISS